METAKLTGTNAVIKFIGNPNNHLSHDQLTPGQFVITFLGDNAAFEECEYGQVVLVNGTTVMIDLATVNATGDYECTGATFPFDLKQYIMVDSNRLARTAFFRAGRKSIRYGD